MLLDSIFCDDYGNPILREMACIAIHIICVIFLCDPCTCIIVNAAYIKIIGNIQILLLKRIYSIFPLKVESTCKKNSALTNVSIFNSRDYYVFVFSLTQVFLCSLCLCHLQMIQSQSSETLQLQNGVITFSSRLSPLSNCISPLCENGFSHLPYILLKDSASG